MTTEDMASKLQALLANTFSGPLPKDPACCCQGEHTDFGCPAERCKSLVRVGISAQLTTVASAIGNGSICGASFSWQEGDQPTLTITPKTPLNFIMTDLLGDNTDANR